MALPTIATPTYTLKVPSTNKSITYRPFLVKEEKILLMAMESEQEQDMADALRQIINNCVSTAGFDATTLAVFDLEYIFLNLRAKSVGEIAEPRIRCPECDTEIILNVDLTKVKVKKDRKHKAEIPLSENIGVTMKYPDVVDLLKLETPIDPEAGESEIDRTFTMIQHSIENIWDENSVYPAKDHTEEEMTVFLESLTTEHFEKIQQFYETMPRLEHKMKYKCTNEECDHTDEMVLRGMQDFFY